MPGWTGSPGETAQRVWVSGSEDDERSGSGKGLPKDHRKEARAPPRNLRANWVQGILSSEKGYGLPWPQGLAAFSPRPRNMLTEPHCLGTLERRETGTVLASKDLCLPSQALGLALGTRPAESREETPIYPRKDGGWEAPPSPRGQSNSNAQCDSSPGERWGASNGRRTLAL